MGKLNGKVILVTGGAQGLGKEIVKSLAEAEAVVIIGDIQEQKADELVKALAKPNVSFNRLDISSEKNVEGLINKIKNEYGRLDAIVNNAGIDFTKSILDLSVAEWDAAMNVNLRGPFLTAKFSLPIMAEQRSGHIINVVSTAALRAWTEAAVYHASKWGLRGFTQALFTEARRFGVKVTALIAGGMRTPFLLDRFPDIPLENLQDPANVAKKIQSLLEDDTDTIVPEMMVIPMKETSWP